MKTKSEDLPRYDLKANCDDCGLEIDGHRHVLVKVQRAMGIHEARQNKLPKFLVDTSMPNCPITDNTEQKHRVDKKCGWEVFEDAEIPLRLRPGEEVLRVWIGDSGRLAKWEVVDAPMDEPVFSLKKTIEKMEKEAGSPSGKAEKKPKIETKKEVEDMKSKTQTVQIEKPMEAVVTENPNIYRSMDPSQVAMVVTDNPGFKSVLQLNGFMGKEAEAIMADMENPAEYHMPKEPKIPDCQVAKFDIRLVEKILKLMRKMPKDRQPNAVRLHVKDNAPFKLEFLDEGKERKVVAAFYLAPKDDRN